MVDKKISELSSNGTLDGTESTVLVQSGSNVKVLLSAIKSYILTTTMQKITVNTYDDIPAFASLLSDYIIKVKSSERNGGFSTIYYFDFDNQSLSWIPTVGI